MPDKTAKTAAKATGAKATASKVAAKTAAQSRRQDCAAKAAAVAPRLPSLRPKPLSSLPKAAVRSRLAAAPRVEEPKKVLTQRQGFKTNEFVVYPAHGVGQILAIEEQEIAGAKLELFVINFMKDKMTLRVPTAKVANVGMRKLSEPALVKQRARDAEGPRPRQAHDVVAPRAGIRSQDQFGRHRRDRRSGARSVSLRVAARAVLQRTPAL